jgi:hypothetical protein
MIDNNSVPTQEEEDRILHRIATIIHKRGLGATAALFIESSMPLAWITGELSRTFVSPFLSIFTDDTNASDKLISVLEKRSNLDKLIMILEEMEEEDKKKRGEVKAKK